MDVNCCSAVVKSMALPSPMSDIDFFDTHDILTIFHLMQYIAIFSRYFPSVNWPKILQNLIPGVRMLTFLRQNGLFILLKVFSPLKYHKRCPIFGTKYLLKGPRLFGSLFIFQGLYFQCKF